MTPEEIVSRLKAGETVILYYPQQHCVGVGRRTLRISPTNANKFTIGYPEHYKDSTFKFVGGLLEKLCEWNHNYTNWWLAYAQSLRLNAKKAEKYKDA
jgi:hypothetical protein